MSDLRVMGRATQGVKLINLEKRNDEIASVCKVISEKDEEVASAGGEESELITSESYRENTLPFDDDVDDFVEDDIEEVADDDVIDDSEEDVNEDEQN